MILAARSFAFLTLVVVLGVLGQWSAAVDEHVWRIPAAAWLIGIFIEGLLARRMPLEFERELPRTAYLGRALDTRLHVDNPLLMPLALQVAEAHPDGVSPAQSIHAWTLAPEQSQSVASRVVPNQLGEMHWDTLRVRVRGRFGLAWWARKLPAKGTVRVFPDHLGQDAHQAGSSERGPRRKPSPGEGTELHSLREYRPGDPLREVDWKATARRGTPMIRIREVDESISLILAIDIGRGSSIVSGSLNRLGHFVNIASRLAEEALNGGDQVGLVAFADGPLASIPPTHGRHALSRLRSQLGALQGTNRDANPLAGALQVRHLCRRRSLVVMLTEIEASQASVHLLQATSLLSPRHMLMIGSLVDESLEAMRWQDAVSRDASWNPHWRTPYEMLSALELSRESRRTRLKLERQGVKVVQARAAELDERIRSSYALLRRSHRI